MNKELIKRMKLFLKYNNATEDEYYRKVTEFNTKYMQFTNKMEEEYLKEKNLEIIFDFKDFDNFCCNYLLNEIKEITNE